MRWHPTLCLEEQIECPEFRRRVYCFASLFRLLKTDLEPSFCFHKKRRRENDREDAKSDKARQHLRHLRTRRTFRFALRT
ncbi:hypothetical protein CEXT_617631 [Caerostris extrusa]|uniref:Uncharacterized protein n=1 Tax=Caerostris extrusa TaxID=172846 RepID=A0AAV4PS41_CAEEX|nr:hypothetical protein CEXT_617631 [Caerostris extrusa]